MPKPYTHEQTIASTIWVVNHNLGHKPVTDVVVTVGGAQEKILPGQVAHITDNQLQVTFAAARTGTVRMF